MSLFFLPHSVNHMSDGCRCTCCSLKERRSVCVCVLVCACVWKGKRKRIRGKSKRLSLRLCGRLLCGTWSDSSFSWLTGVLWNAGEAASVLTVEMHIFFPPALIKTARMAPIGAVNIANGCGIIHRQPGLGRERKRRGEVWLFSSHNRRRSLMISLRLGSSAVSTSVRVTRVWPSVRARS